MTFPVPLIVGVVQALQPCGVVYFLRSQKLVDFLQTCSAEAGWRVVLLEKVGEVGEVVLVALVYLIPVSSCRLCEERRKLREEFLQRQRRSEERI